MKKNIFWASILVFTIFISISTIAPIVINVNTYNMDSWIRSGNVFVNTRSAFWTNGTNLTAPANFYRTLVNWPSASDQFNWTYNPINTTANIAGGSTYSLVVNITDQEIDPSGYEISTQWLNLSNSTLVTARDDQFLIHFYYLPQYPENSDYTGALEVTTNTTRNILEDPVLIIFNSTNVLNILGSISNITISPITIGHGKSAVTWYNISFILQGYDSSIYDTFTTALKFSWSYSCIACGTSPNGNYYYLINHE